ncbi:MAG: tRNA preQ1(34) S-adenosylmethionine ribosyltransferase-isomerase QueA [Tepidisphaerales bacterium]
MRADELDFSLPPELIAQAPLDDRAASRLLHYRRQDRGIEHRRFADLPGLLRPGDLLVFNDAKVLPARFTLRKESGGLIEGLYLGVAGATLGARASSPASKAAEDGRAPRHPLVWRVLLRALGKVHPDRPLVFADAPEIAVRVLRKLDDEGYELAVEGAGLTALEVLSRVGRMPLPPYIKRQKHHDDRDEFDKDRYQTVYARNPGSVAAPTAGLHFTTDVLAALDARGIRQTFVTLHVGLGTFKPVDADSLEAHHMHVETYTLPSNAAEAINSAKRDGRRIVAVGTTACRVIESQPADGPFVARDGETGIFIYPPYRWKHVGAMVTNFHLPRSTLIALVAALVGLDEQRRIYREAIERRYRFFSYGDAMLIE